MSCNNPTFEMYPWLRVRTTVEEYVSPAYYDRLLKKYSFEEKDDLQYFKEYLQNFKQPKDLCALELGPGTGRATDIFLETITSPCESLHLVDLSIQMLSWSREKFKNQRKIHFFNSDTIQYLTKTPHSYDLIFSLWSFSHSVHQNLFRDNSIQGQAFIENAIQKMFRVNMKPGAKFFLIHFDSMSDEQRILIQHWKRVFPIEAYSQSPSKRLIDEILIKLEREGLVQWSSNHFIGDPIIYSSIDEALEVFFNFHLESHFNQSEDIADMIEETIDYFKEFSYLDGSIHIRPGCFIYNVARL